MGSSIALSSMFTLKSPLAEAVAGHTLNGIPPNVIGCVLYWLSLWMHDSSRPKMCHGIEKNLGSLTLWINFKNNLNVLVRNH